MLCFCNIVYCTFLAKCVYVNRYEDEPAQVQLIYYFIMSHRIELICVRDARFILLCAFIEVVVSSAVYVYVLVYLPTYSVLHFFLACIFVYMGSLTTCLGPLAVCNVDFKAGLLQVKKDCSTTTKYISIMYQYVYSY